jgi:uncharacterized protein (TIGR02231 family)
MVRFSLFLLLSFLSIDHCVFGQSNKITKAEIKQATVYLNRAHLVSVATALLDAGKNEIIISSLPNGINEQSIQVSGKGHFTILAVKYEMDFQKPHESSPERKSLEDSLDFYEFQLSSLKDFEDIMRKEEQMLVSNQTIAGKTESLDADDLEYFANFFRKRLLDIRFQILKNTRDIRVMTENVNRIKRQIQTIGNDREPAGRIVLSVLAENKQNASFELSYIVYNAGWYPVYDLKVKEAGEPVAVTSKAVVVQQTGVSWDKVKLTLSTGNPAIGGQNPELNPWYVSVYEEKENAFLTKKTQKPSSAKNEAQAEMRLYSPSSVADMTTVVETALAVEYAISIPYTVPSSQSGQMVEIQNITLDADYKYYAVPKMSKSAYLVALVNGYEDKNLISGKANVYFEGSYIGETFLDVNTTNDTIELSLGIDKNIVVEYDAIKDFKSKKLIGFNKKEEFGYRIKIRNTKKKAIDITVQDQIPLSRDSQIKIETNEVSKAEKNEESGMLIWRKTIEPAETLELVTRFTVEYPKSKKVQGLR